jgi:NitT/TauT family transport system permease protein
MDGSSASLLEGAASTTPSRRRRLSPRGAAAPLAWLGAALLTAFWPDSDDWPYTIALGSILGAVGAALLATVLVDALWGGGTARLRRLGPWLLVVALGLAGWELITAKLNLLPRPFFGPPQALIDVYLDDWPRLGESVLRSLALLLTGYAIGASTGFVLGVATGWWRVVGYWVHPVLRLIGPLPATAWLPIAFFLFPSSWSASIFLIALATAFPVTVLTWSGIAGVASPFYDIARTLGARLPFLIFKVAIPAAMPSVFVGLFMGLGASFAVLVVAEMLGVKAGLGWYLQWAQGWAAYANMYAALLVMAVMCSGLITLLFRLRDRLLSWQKGLVRW